MNLLLNASLHLYGGLQAHSNSIKSSEAGKHARQQIAAHTLLNWIFWQKDSHLATLSVAARNEWYSNYGSIFLPRSGINIILNDWRFFVSAGMNYRVPTLNELFWDPGGNPELNAEHSTALESGINYSWDAYGFWEFKFSFYYITLKEMIRWHPTQSGIWRPENLDVVSSKGLEIQTKFKIIQDRLQGTINYKYGLSILEETSELNKATQGNRLPYLPATEINTHIMGNWYDFRLGLEIEYLSYRYITIANLNYQYLPAVTLFNIYADYQYDWHSSTIIIYTRLNNIFKNDYQIINNYPLPLWEWKIGMQFDILNK
jgi:iron complex outermembrane receptor protein